MQLGQYIRDNSVSKSGQSLVAGHNVLLSESIVRAFDHTSIGIIYLGTDSKIRCFNQKIIQILNINIDKNKSPSFEDVIKYSQKTFKNSKDLESQFWLPIKDYYNPQELILETYDNKILFCSSQAVIEDGLIEGVVWSITDITEHKTQERIATRRSLHDALTQLPNRTYLFQKLEALTGPNQCQNTKFALLFLDLDDFKKVNDEYGHTIGDQVLINFSTKLRASLRVPDTLARLSGDEFVAIVEGLDSPEAVELIIERIYQNLSDYLQVPEVKVKASASIGISFYPSQSIHCRELLRQADKARYCAKHKGKNTFCFYDPSMES